MTDQRWDVEGGAGGAAGERDGGSSRREPADGLSGATGSDAQSAKVVPFPGNWFGAVEDLVPVGFESELAHPEPVPHGVGVPRGAEARRPVAQAASASVDAASPAAADASDFWEGDAATLQEVSAATDSPASIALLRSPAAVPRESSSRRGRAPRSPADEKSEMDGDARSGDSPRRRARLAAIGAVLLSAVVAASVVAAQAINGAARRPGHLAPAVRKHQPRAVTQTITSRVTVTTKAPPRAHRHRSVAVPHKKSAAGGRSSASTVAPSADNSSGAQLSTGAVSSSTAVPPEASGNSPGATASGNGSGATASPGSGCVQSPDSGCLP